MVFDEILGQPAAVATLSAALQRGRVHHAYRFEGPRGVGKEMCALAFAKALICPADGRAASHPFTPSEAPPHLPSHPDLVFVSRGLYRDCGVDANEATGISIEQIRKVVLSRVGFPPHQGRALVFIVRDADELTVSAANALLKTLEEPRPNVHFLLVTSNPERLLDTVRSRTLPLRFGPLPDLVIEQILRKADKPSELSALAQGSAGLALLLADPEEMQARDEFISAALTALKSPNFSASLDVAADLPKERDSLRELLRALCQHFSSVARGALATDCHLALQAARRFACVTEALRSIERNGQSALVVETMLSQLRRT